MFVGSAVICSVAGQSCPEQDFDEACLSTFYQRSPPKGMENLTFANYGPQHPGTARLCLGGHIASLYDCKLRIPLWTAMSLSSKELRGGDAKRKGDFQDNFPSGLVAPTFRQTSDDYVGLNRLIHRGHLISVQYAGKYESGNTNKARERIAATFSYYNAVPQYGHTNTGAWLTCEASLIEWAKKGIRSDSTAIYCGWNCALGVVPTHLRLSEASNISLPE